MFCSSFFSFLFFEIWNIKHLFTEPSVGIGITKHSVSLEISKNMHVNYKISGWKHVHTYTHKSRCNSENVWSTVLCHAKKRLKISRSFIKTQAPWSINLTHWQMFYPLSRNLACQYLVYQTKAAVSVLYKNSSTPDTGPLLDHILMSSISTRTYLFYMQLTFLKTFIVIIPL